MRSRKPWRAGRRSPEASGGFTLLEAIAVLVLIVVLTAAVWMRATHTGAAVAAEAAILRGHLRFVQAMAMANNTVVWSVQIGGTSYTMQRDGAPSPLHLPDESSATRQLASGVTIAGGGGVLTFNEWGVPDQGRVVVLSDGVSQQTVAILGGTGFIP